MWCDYRTLTCPVCRHRGLFAGDGEKWCPDCEVPMYDDEDGGPPETVETVWGTFVVGGEG